MSNQRSWLAAALAVLGLAVSYHSHLRPWMYRWGSTPEERAEGLPGDDLVREHSARTTRSITIRASAEAIWPWLAQIGEDRGGFYSYGLLERAVGVQVHNAHRIHPEWQDVRVGDTVWLARRYGTRASQAVAAVEPGSHLILVSQRDFERLGDGEKAVGSWAFYIQPGATDARFVVRGSGGAIGHVLYDVPHFFMEQKMMRAIRDRAQRTHPAFSQIA